MLFPSSWWSAPSVPDSSELSDDERSLIVALHSKMVAARPDLELDLAYYLGEQVVQNLRIAVPKELEHLKTVLGWAAVAVDPIVERLAIDGFRLPNETDINETLTHHWETNGMDAAQSMLWTDALTMRRGYLMVGAREGGGARITNESPLNVSVDYAPDGVTPRSVLAHYTEDGKQRATLMRPRLTLILEQDGVNGEWSLVRRENHRLDFVPVERVANRPLTHARDGRSEVTAPMRSTIDNTARTLLGQIVSGEVFAAPRWAILGAQESDFVDANGQPKSGYSTFVTRIFGMERDEDGNVPSIHQFAAYDPATFTKIVEMNASQFSGMAAATPGDLGLYTQGNPTSAEALEVSESRRNRRARLRQREYGVPVIRAMQHAIRFENNGRLPAEFERIAIDWMPLVEPSLPALSDGVAKLVKENVLPPTSDVTLKRLGFSAVERAQLEMDRDADGMAALEQIAAGVNEQQAAASSADES